MPVLDLQLWLEKDESGVGVVRFEYYEKPIASKVVIHKKSAISWTVKRSTLVSEVYRRLYNCDPQVEWQERTEYVNHLVIKMWRSGYSEADIKCFVKGGVGRYEKMLERVNTGERPLYRDTSFQAPSWQTCCSRWPPSAPPHRWRFQQLSWTWCC